jgi:hypothetical protein
MYTFGRQRLGDVLIEFDATSSAAHLLRRQDKLTGGVVDERHQQRPGKQTLGTYYIDLLAHDEGERQANRKATNSKTVAKTPLVTPEFSLAWCAYTAPTHCNTCRSPLRRLHQA